MTNKPTALVPSVVREVMFDGDVLLVAMVGNVPYVALRPIAEFLGLEWSAQFRRVQRDDVLAEEAQLVAMAAADGRQRDMFSIPLEYLPGWLFGITSSKAAKPEYASKIKLYRRKCFRVLWQTVQTDLLPYVEATIVEMEPHPASLAATQYDELLGVANLVREHLEILTGAVVPMNEKVDYMVRLLEALVGRQEVTETKIAQIDQRTQRLTPEHTRTVAEYVEQMVHRTAKAPVPLDHYKIYGRLKHHFRTNSYKEVADSRFDEMMTYLAELLRQALGGELPQQGSLF